MAETSESEIKKTKTQIVLKHSQNFKQDNVLQYIYMCTHTQTQTHTHTNTHTHTVT